MTAAEIKASEIPKISRWNSWYLWFLVIGLFGSTLWNSNADDTNSYNVTIGSRFSISASSVGLNSFSALPKVYISGGTLGNKKKKIKVLTSKKEFHSGALNSIQCEFTQKVESGTYDLYLLPSRKDSVSFSKHREQNNLQNITSSKRKITPVKVSSSFSVESPVISTITPFTGESGDKITVTGMYFGSKPPKVYFTYTDTKTNKEKKVSAKVDKKNLNYTDIKGKPSCMDPDTGESSISLFVPRKIETSTECKVWIENKIGKDNVTFNSEQFSVSGAVSGDITSTVTITLRGKGLSDISVTTSSDGRYSFSGIPKGNYIITPKKNGYSFSPESYNITITGSNITDMDFKSSQDTSETEDVIFAGQQMVYSNAEGEITIAWPEAFSSSTETSKMKYRIFLSKTSSHLYDDSNLTATVTGTCETILKSLNSDTTYYVLVVAEDAYGNRSSNRDVSEVKTLSEDVKVKKKPQVFTNSVSGSDVNISSSGDSEYEVSVSGTKLKLRKNRYVILPTSDYGMRLFKVKEVEKADASETKFSVEQASLDELIPEGKIRFSAVLTPMDKIPVSSDSSSRLLTTLPNRRLIRSSVKIFRREKFPFYIHPEGKFIIWDSGPDRFLYHDNEEKFSYYLKSRNRMRRIQIIPGVSFDFSLDFTPILNFEYDWSLVRKYVYASARLGGTLDINGTLTIGLDKEYTFSKEKTLLKLSRRFFYTIGSVPVAQKVTLELKAKFEVTADAELNFKLKPHLSKTLAINITLDSSASGVWSVSKQEGFTKEFTYTFTDKAGLTVKLTIWPEITTTFYETVEGSFAVQPYVQLSAEMDLLPRTYFTKFDVDFGCDGEVGAGLTGIAEEICNLLGIDPTYSTTFPIVDPIKILSLPSVSFETAPSTGTTYTDNSFAIKITDGVNNPVSADSVYWYQSPELSGNTLTSSEDKLTANFNPMSTGTYTISAGVRGDNTAFLGEFGEQRTSSDITISNKGSYSISGQVSGDTTADVTITLSGDASATTTTDSSGKYEIDGLPDGSYTLTPSKAGYTFTPSSQNVTLAGASKDNINFTAVSSGGNAKSLYIIVDLTTGKITNSDSVPSDLLTNNEYKTTKIVLRKIPAGTFQMGSPQDERGRYSDEYQHTVTITTPFYMSVFECTQAQYKQITGELPSGILRNDAYPVFDVCWNEVRGGTFPGGDPDSNSFFGKLREKTGAAFDLPTEAQWEYACRAGTTKAYNNDKDCLTAADGDQDTNLDPIAWYKYNHTNLGSPSVNVVGLKQPNNWGLYDMHGNVREYCLDWYQYNYYQNSPANDPQGPDTGIYKITRGGCCFDKASNCRAANRVMSHLTTDDLYSGIRICLPASN